MNDHLGLGGSALAETARQLEDDRLDMAGITQGLIGVVAAIPRVSPGEWSGPASMAYGAACDQVARDCIAAVSHLETSGNLLIVASVELGNHA
jgi:hypothetical protein